MARGENKKEKWECRKVNIGARRTEGGVTERRDKNKVKKIGR